MEGLEAAILDMPKSVTLAWWLAFRRMLLLDRSRWRVPFLCRWATARAMSWEMFTWTWYIGYVGWRALQKVCQTVFHHLHEENGLVGCGVLDHTQELDNVGVFQVSQDLALLLKSRDEVRESRVLGVNEDSMEDFSSTWLFIQCCHHHIAIGSRAQDLGCVDHHILIAIQTAEIQWYVIWITGLVKEEGGKGLQLLFIFAPGEAVRQSNSHLVSWNGTCNNTLSISTRQIDFFCYTLALAWQYQPLSHARVSLCICLKITLSTCAYSSYK